MAHGAVKAVAIAGLAAGAFVGAYYLLQGSSGGGGLQLSVSVDGLVATVTCTGGTPNGPAEVTVCPEPEMSDECASGTNFQFDANGDLDTTVTAPPGSTPAYMVVTDTTTGALSNWVYVPFSSSGGNCCNVACADSSDCCSSCPSCEENPNGIKYCVS
jgi:hypothetical protein